RRRRRRRAIPGCRRALQRTLPACPRDGSCLWPCSTPRDRMGSSLHVSARGQFVLDHFGKGPGRHISEPPFFTLPCFVMTLLSVAMLHVAMIPPIALTLS